MKDFTEPIIFDCRVPGGYPYPSAKAFDLDTGEELRKIVAYNSTTGECLHHHNNQTKVIEVGGVANFFIERSLRRLKFVPVEPLARKPIAYGGVEDPENEPRS